MLILTLGTRGDFEQFLALAKELARRGHEIAFATSPFYSKRVHGANLKHLPVGTAEQSDLVSIIESLSKTPDKYQRTKAYCEKWVKPQFDESVDTIFAEAAGCDYFVNNLKLVLSKGDDVIPGAIVTYDLPSDLSELDQYGIQNHKGRILELVALPKALVDPTSEWPTPYKFTGFWLDRSAQIESLDSALERFIEVGEPPVVATLGSMAMIDLDKFVEAFSEALDRLGKRGVLVKGWSQPTNRVLQRGSVFLAADAAYASLFPRASCIIHHGGCGTVAWALEAGKTSVLLPQLACQENLASLLLREKLATMSFEDSTSLDPGDLASAIQEAISSQECATAARRFKSILEIELGVHLAADLIEEHHARVAQSIQSSTFYSFQIAT